MKQMDKAKQVCTGECLRAQRVVARWQFRSRQKGGQATPRHAVAGIAVVLT
jgi:hypothetical protein